VTRTLKPRAVKREASLYIGDIQPRLDKVVPIKTKAFHSENVMVDPKDTPILLRPGGNIPQTYVTVNKSTKQMVHLTTVMPDGLHVAWSTCGTCHRYFSHCSCKGGLSVSRSVEYIYDTTVARLAGEEWTINHPNYRGSTTRAQREAVAARSSVVATNVRPITPPHPQKPVSGQSGASDGVSGKRRLRRNGEAPATAPAQQVVEPDLAKMNAGAKADAESLTKTMKRVLKKAVPAQQPARKMRRIKK
jgi:hypothetical protein